MAYLSRQDEAFLCVGNLSSDAYLARLSAGYLIKVCHQGKQVLAVRHLEALLTLGELDLLQRILGRLIQENCLWLYIELAGMLCFDEENQRHRTLINFHIAPQQPAIPNDVGSPVKSESEQGGNVEC